MMSQARELHELKAEMEAAHVRGPLPDMRPSVPDAKKPNPYRGNIQSNTQIAQMDAALHACFRICLWSCSILANANLSSHILQARELQEQKARLEAEMKARVVPGEVTEVRCLDRQCLPTGSMKIASVFQQDR